MKLTNILILALISQVVFAQADRLNLTEKVQTSSLVFEGIIVSDSSYFTSNHANILSIKYVQVLKQFKGQFLSDTIKIVAQETERHVGNYNMTTVDGGYFVLPVGLHAVFFCVPVKNDKYYQIYTDGIYEIKLECYGLVEIESKLVQERFNIVNCDTKMYLADIDKELFAPLEKIVGEKYKVVGQSAGEKK